MESVNSDLGSRSASMERTARTIERGMPFHGKIYRRELDGLNEWRNGWMAEWTSGWMDGSCMHG